MVNKVIMSCLAYVYYWNVETHGDGEIKNRYLNMGVLDGHWLRVKITFCFPIDVD